MALARETPLLTTVAEVVDITHVLDLANLETDAEFSTTDALAEAHRWVYDRAEGHHGPDALAALTNQTALSRAVAFRLMEVLSAPGAPLASVEGTAYWGAQAREAVDGFRPTFSGTTSEARRSDEAVISVGNFEDGWTFGPTRRRRGRQDYWSGFPGRQQ